MSHSLELSRRPAQMVLDTARKKPMKTAPRVKPNQIFSEMKMSPIRKGTTRIY